jgi:prolyl-tRNA synthetase
MKCSIPTMASTPPTSRKPFPYQQMRCPSTLHRKFEKLETPNTPTIESLAKFLKCSPTQIVKNVLYQATFDSGKAVLVLVSIRGDQDVNDVKLIERTDQAGRQLWRQHPAGPGSTR